MDLYKGKSYDEAIRHYEAKLSSTSNGGPEEIQLLHCIASCQYRMELYRKAIKTCLKVIELDKTDVKALILMGKSYHRIGGNSAALQAFQNALNASLSKEDLAHHILVQELIDDFNKATNESNKAPPPPNSKSSASSVPTKSASSPGKKGRSGGGGTRDKDSSGAPAVTMAG